MPGTGITTRWLSLLVALLFTFTSSACSRGRDETILIPHGFTGPVVILFNHPQGDPVQKENGAMVFQVSSDGIVRTQAPPVNWVTNFFYYVSPTGERTLLPQDRDGELDQIQVFAAMSGMGAYAFMVGRADMWDRPRTVLNDRFREVLGIGQ